MTRESGEKEQQMLERIQEKQRLEHVSCFCRENHTRHI